MSLGSHLCDGVFLTGSGLPDNLSRSLLAKCVIYRYSWMNNSTGHRLHAGHNYGLRMVIVVAVAITD